MEDLPYLGCARGRNTSAFFLSSSRTQSKASIAGHRGNKRHARSHVGDADVLHVDGDIVLVREAVGHARNVLVLSDDALAHLVERRLYIPTISQP